MIRCLVVLLLLGVHSAQAEVRVTDFIGREVIVPAPATRIVALAPHVVENLFSAGAGDKIVGAVEHSDYPPAATNIPRVGNHNSWSLESIAALRPDLVVVWGSGNAGGKLARLEQLGIPVFVSELRKPQDIAEAIRRLGILAGTSDHSEPAAKALETALATLGKRYAHATRLSVFYQIWNDPLLTVNGDHMISEVMNLCGGRNAFADLAQIAPRINVESVLSRDPDVILASGMGDARPDWVDDWRRYPALAAVRYDNLFFIHPDHLQRATSRILQGAETLCAQLQEARQRIAAEGSIMPPS